MQWYCMFRAIDVDYVVDCRTRIVDVVPGQNIHKRAGGIRDGEQSCSGGR